MFPLRTLRYIIGIARKPGEEQNVTDNIILEMANWLKKYVAKEDNRKQMVNVMIKFYWD
ncbi:MAG TPA: hypothetical protein VLD84_10310 [Nitrososphaeraceae archaeon]|nr:hypothetical protein [Nitrososphaeraceae archaeon]